MINDHNAHILSTERQFTGLRHVPVGMDQYEVHNRQLKTYDPHHDEEIISAEVAQVLRNVLYAMQLSGDGPIVLYCKSPEIRDRAAKHMTEEQRRRIQLEVSL